MAVSVRGCKGRLQCCRFYCSGSNNRRNLAEAAARAACRRVRQFARLPRSAVLLGNLAVLRLCHPRIIGGDCRDRDCGERLFRQKWKEVLDLYLDEDRGRKRGMEAALLHLCIAATSNPISLWQSRCRFA